MSSKKRFEENFSEENRKPKNKVKLKNKNRYEEDEFNRGSIKKLNLKELKNANYD